MSKWLCGARNCLHLVHLSLINSETAWNSYNVQGRSEHMRNEIIVDKSARNRTALLRDYICQLVVEFITFYWEINWDYKQNKYIIKMG